MADVYSVIAYYLRHRDDVQEYLANRQQQAAETRAQNKQRADPSGVRDRLLARRK
jgi:hypothetical protein